jgi:hypothetical protein
MALHRRILGLGLLYSLTSFGAQYAPGDRPYWFEFDDTKWEVVAGAKTPATQDVDKAMEGLTLTTLQRKEADDKYRARFSVVVDDPKKTAGKNEPDLASYAKHAVDFMKGQRFHVQSAESKILPMLGVPAYEIVANQRDFGLTFRQVVFLWDRNGKKEAYLLTAATRTNKYDAYKGEVDRFFNTFTMKK